MSRPWRERVHLAVGPREVLRLRRMPGLRAARIESAATPVALAADGPPWRAALDALAGSLAAAPVERSAAVRVVISNHFVRYAVAPWREDLRSPAEREAFVRHAFGETYGEAAAAWRVRESPQPFGRASLACAVDPGLLDGLADTLAGAGLAAEAVEPLFMVAFNAVRRTLAAPGCLVVHEPGRLAGGHFDGRDWRGVFCVRAGEAPLRAEIERELLLNGVPAEAQVFACTVDAAAPAASPTWPLRPLGLAPGVPAVAGGLA